MTFVTSRTVLAHLDNYILQQQLVVTTNNNSLIMKKIATYEITLQNIVLKLTQKLYKVFHNVLSPVLALNVKVHVSHI